VAELTGRLGVDVALGDPPDDAVELFELPLPWRAAICELTRLSARWLAMPANPVV